MEKTVSEAIAYRRSVRIYNNNLEINSELVEECLKNAALAPTSSNLQLWEFYHVINKDIKEKVSKACFDQPAAKTAQQLVIVVTRKDLWKRRAKANLDFLEQQFSNSDESNSTREKFALNYYKKLIPSLYTEVFGILGLLKFIVFSIIGLFKPMYREVRRSDMRVVAHKSAALAAQNFMISMAAIGYDTCPMEGSDTKRIKKILKLPYGAEINMVIGCGIREDKGIYGPRFRVPFKNVYHKI
ncbi:MAG: nitroreductase family protein [Eudoraea sp.]|uniref:nitroreductase family protein n=1 Tax=Eudoraea sp. TaxID=1979955 RepID=UPI003C74195A